MKKLFYKFVSLTAFLILIGSPLLADNVYFIDFSKVLNNSNAGAAAQSSLKKKFQEESNKFLNKENQIKKDEQDLIAEKKVLSSEEYKKKVEDLRKRVNLLQKEKQESLNSIAKSRAKAKQDLISAINPILKTYMEKNNIRLVIDKQNIILGDTTLEITDLIIEILNKELKSININ